MAVAGDVGRAIVETIRDENGDPLNVSTAETMTILVRHHTAETASSLEAEHLTDGTDGKITADSVAGTFAAGEVETQGLAVLPGGDTYRSAPSPWRIFRAL